MHKSSAQHYMVEMSTRGGVITGELRRDGSSGALPLFDLALGPEVKPLDDRPETLGAIVGHIVAMGGTFAHEFDERFQLALGDYLYREIFDGASSWEMPSSEGDIEVEIVTEDEHIGRLPWVLLARDGIFLCTTGWSVSLARPRGRRVPCELPPSPKMLIVAPDVAGLGGTDAGEHLAELETLLSTADRRLHLGENLRVVSTWEGLQSELRVFKPALLYYYGHGIGGFARSRLVFENPDLLYSKGPVEMSMADLALLLRQCEEEGPLLAYINCCAGDAGGWLGAGWQVGEVVPAVLTNRTRASIGAARAQAKAFWHALVIKGEPPHKAVSGMYNRMGDLGLTFQDARWMTPVLHRRYVRWRSNPPQPEKRGARNPHWHVKLDRTRQVGQVFHQANNMVRERRPRARAYFWYGEEGQGVELFHERLVVELRSLPERTSVYERRPRWPDDLARPNRSFADMMTEAFEVDSFDDIAGRIRTHVRSLSRETSLVYVRHSPLRRNDSVRPEDMRVYLEWWDQKLTPVLREAGAFGLLGISFIAKNPPLLNELLGSNVNDLDLRNMFCDVLDEMEKIARVDLAAFLRENGVFLPQDRKEAIIQDILRRTAGRYEMTLEAIKVLVDEPIDAAGASVGASDKATAEDW